MNKDKSNGKKIRGGIYFILLPLFVLMLCSMLALPYDNANADAAYNFTQNAVSSEPRAVTDTTITLTTESGFEYCVEDSLGNIVAGCNWTAADGSGTLTFNVAENTNYVVKAREIGSNTKQPGVSTAVEVKTKLTAVLVAQDGAKEVLDTTASAAKAEIDGLVGLTQTVKDELKRAIDTAVATGKESIESTDTVDAVDSAKAGSISKVSTVLQDAKDLVALKGQTNNAIELAAENAKGKIDALDSLSDADKTNAKANIDTAVTSAKAEISNAANTNAVSIAKDNADTAINTVVSTATDLNTAKLAAIAAINQKFEAEKAIVNEFQNINQGGKVSQEYRDALIAKLENARDAGIQAVADSADSDMTALAQTNCTVNLDRVEAIGELDITLAIRNAALENYVGTKLTQLEADTFKTGNQKWYDRAVNEINNTTESETIDKNVFFAANKFFIETVVSDVLYEKKLAMAEANKLSADNPRKTELINAIDSSYDATKDSLSKIDAGGNSVTVDVQKIILPGRLDINKLQAKAETELSVQEAISRADNLIEPYLSTEKDKITAALATANTAIDAATQIDANNNANTPKKIADVHQLIIDKLGYGAELLAAKNDAYAKLDSYATTDNAAAVSAKKSEIDGAYNTALANIASSTDTGEKPNIVPATENAKIAMQNGIDAINNLVFGFAVSNASAIVNKIVNESSPIMGGLTNLTAQQKEQVKIAIDAAAQTAKDAITANGATLDDIDTAEQTLKDAVADIILSAQKDDAKNALDKIADTAKDAINNNPNLSDAEKVAKVADAETALATAKDAVANADTLADVTTEKTGGNTAINNVKVAADELGNTNLAAAKDTATTDLDSATNAAKNAINNNPNLSDAEKAAKVADAEDALATAKDAVASADTLADVTTEKTGGNSAINNVKVEADELGNINLATAKAATLVDLNAFIKDYIGDGKYSDDYDQDGKSAIVSAIEKCKNAIVSASKIEDLPNKLTSAKGEVIDIATKAPSANLDYDNNRISGLKPNIEYTVNDGTKDYTLIADDNGTISIRGTADDQAYDFTGKTLTIIKVAVGGVQADSKLVIVAIERHWSFRVNYNGTGTADVIYKVKDGQSAPIQSEPTRNGFEFLGWFQDSDCTVEWNFKYGTVKADTVIYAGWKAEHSGVNTVVVSFVAEGQPNITKTVNINTLVKPANVTAPDWKSFAGWYIDADFTYKYDFKSKVTENLTLYAKFEASMIVVTMPDGTGNELNYGDKLSRPADPSKDGYTFAGWYTDSECNDVLLFANDKTKDGITKNITLYPKWVQSTHTVTGTITDQNGNPIANTDITIEVQPGGKTIKTDANGKFTVVDVPDGNYRIVVKYQNGSNTTVVTEAVRVSGADVSVPNIRMSGVNLNSTVDIGENAPDIAVSGLNDLFGNDKYVSKAEKDKAKVSGNSVELKFVVTDLGKVKSFHDYAVGNNKRIGSYLDFSLFKIMTVNGEESTSYLSSLDNLLKVIIPLAADVQGKSNYMIYRIHNGEMQEIKLGADNANELGEYLELSEDGKFLTVYTKSFSSYAIAFDEQVPTSTADSACFIHWILIEFILAFLILITVFTLRFNKKCLANLITWGCFTVAIIVLAFFVWSCTVDIVLWSVGVVISILAVLGYLFVGKNKVKNADVEKQQNTEDEKTKTATTTDSIKK